MTELVLEFDQVTVPREAYYDMGLNNCSFKLHAAELIAVHTSKELVHSPLSAAALGLIETIAGTVRFCGEDWRLLPPRRPAALRSKVGRVFAEDGWISNLDVDENLILAQYYHTARAREEILNEALEIARRLGLSEIPEGRSSGLRRATLRVLEWVRALLGEKVLLILEHPVNRVPRSFLWPLLGEVARARKRGVAVLWITGDTDEWDAVQSVATATYEMGEDHWMRIGERSHA